MTKGGLPSRDRETRELWLRGKVITKPDIQKLAEVLFREHEEARRIRHDSRYRLRLRCDDDTVYESTSTWLVQDKNIIDTKRTVSIRISFIDEEGDRYVDFEAWHGGSNSDVLVVGGAAPEWVRGTFTELKEIVDALRKQGPPYVRESLLGLFLLHAAMVGVFGVSCWSLVRLCSALGAFSPPARGPMPFLVLEAVKAWRYFYETPAGFSWVWLAAGYALVGAICARDAFRWMWKLWPTIEFDFGPEHLRVERRRRSRLCAVAALVILPFVVNVLSTLATR